MRAPGQWLPEKGIFFCGRDESNIFFNEKDDDDGVIGMVWMGPGAPAPTNLLTHQLLIANHTISPKRTELAQFSLIYYLYIYLLYITVDQRFSEKNKLFSPEN